MLNVRDFAAVDNGVVDDTAALGIGFIRQNPVSRRNGDIRLSGVVADGTSQAVFIDGAAIASVQHCVIRGGGSADAQNATQLVDLRFNHIHDALVNSGIDESENNGTVYCENVHVNCRGTIAPSFLSEGRSGGPAIR